MTGLIHHTQNGIDYFLEPNNQSYNLIYQKKISLKQNHIWSCEVNSSLNKIYINNKF